MTDQFDETRENGSPWSQGCESSKPSENRPADQVPIAQPPQALSTASSHVASTPPMQPGEVAPGAMTSAWPTVVGILAIILGGFGVLGGVWGVVYPIVVGSLADAMPQMQAQMELQLGEWSGRLQAVSFVMSLVAGLLLYGGILLAKRRSRAASILFSWSIIKIVLSFAYLGLQVTMQAQVVDQTAAQLQTVPGGRTMMVGAVAFGLVFSGIFMLTGPVFLLIWFRRGVIKQEVATWH